MQPPFFCDHGYNIEADDKVFFNLNRMVLAVMKVSIGNRTVFGPNIQLDLPDDVFAAGNPCKVIRMIDRQPGDKSSFWEV